MSSVVLKDVPSNPSEARVDDVTLVQGGEAQDLNEDQLKRLKATGVKLEVDGDVGSGDSGESAGADDLDSLTGDELDQAAVDADLAGRSTMSADEKRAALKERREGGDQ